MFVLEWILRIAVERLAAKFADVGPVGVDLKLPIPEGPST